MADSVDKVIANRLSNEEKVRLTSPSAVLMLDSRHFELVNPICPECGSKWVTKQEFKEAKAEARWLWRAYYPYEALQVQALQ